MNKIFSLISSVTVLALAIFPAMAGKEKKDGGPVSFETAQADSGKMTLLHNVGCNCAACQQAKEYAKDSIV